MISLGHGDKYIHYDYYDELVRLAIISDEGEWCEQEPDDLLMIDEEAVRFEYNLTIKELYDELLEYPNNYKPVIIEFGYKYFFTDIDIIETEGGIQGIYLI
jgi:hypothetical protein